MFSDKFLEKNGLVDETNFRNFSGIVEPNYENLRLANKAYYIDTKKKKLYLKEGVFPNHKKREDIFKNFDFSTLDDHAKLFSRDRHLDLSLEKFISKLTEECKYQVEKARVIYCWLTFLNWQDISYKNIENFEIRDYLWKTNNDHLKLCEFYQKLCE